MYNIQATVCTVGLTVKTAMHALTLPVYLLYTNIDCFIADEIMPIKTYRRYAGNAGRFFFITYFVHGMLSLEWIEKLLGQKLNCPWIRLSGKIELLNGGVAPMRHPLVTRKIDDKIVNCMPTKNYIKNLIAPVVTSIVSSWKYYRILL